MVSRVLILRHGETEWSSSGRHTGRTDIALSSQGEANASRLASVLAGIHLSRVFSSPRRRALRTCELAGLGAVRVVDPDLAEWDYGDYEGLLTAEIELRRPGWRLFRDGCPGGESAADVSSRADRVIARLRALDGVIAVFSHGHFSRVLAARWVGSGLGLGEHLLLDTASLGVLSFEHNNPDSPVIARWNLGSSGAL